MFDFLLKLCGDCILKMKFSLLVLSTISGTFGLIGSKQRFEVYFGVVA